MKPYLKVLYNLIRFQMKGHLKQRHFEISPVQMFSWNTRFVCGRKSDVTIGAHTVSDGRTVMVVGGGAELTIGSGVYFNEDLMLSCQKKIQIHDGCLFGPNVKIFDNNHKFTAEHGVSADLSCEPVIIGKNCWIGANVTVLKGTQIGDNCVIGAGCVVRGTIPPRSLVTANRELTIQPIQDGVR